MTIKDFLGILVIWCCAYTYAADDVNAPDQEQSDEQVQTTDELNQPADQDASLSQETDDIATQESEGDASTTDPIIRHTPRPNLNRIDDVKRHIQQYDRENELSELEIDNTEYLGLYLPENTGKPQGGILILHDDAQHAHWPETVAPLREYLPDYGWNTLSLFMTAAMQPPLPERPIKSLTDAPIERNQPTNPDMEDEINPPDTAELEQSAEAENESTDEFDPEPTADAEPEDDINAGISDELGDIADSLENVPDTPLQDTSNSLEAEPTLPPEQKYFEHSVQSVRAGIRHLNSIGQFNLVIIAHGLNANWATAMLNEVYEEMDDAKGYTLVLVDARKSEYPTYPLSSMLTSLDIPILDLITHKSEVIVKQAADRKNSMRRANLSQYQQIYIPAIRTNIKGKHNVLTRRVRGWLQTHAAGEEVGVDKG